MEVWVRALVRDSRREVSGHGETVSLTMEIETRARGEGLEGLDIVASRPDEEAA